MLGSYIKTAFRSILRHRLSASINVIGLAVGMAACLVILLYVSHELSFDGFHEHRDRIYRLTNDRYQNGELVQHGVITYPSVAKALLADYPEVEASTRLVRAGRTLVTYEDVRLEQEQIIYADSAFLRMFSFPLVAGDPRSALARPYSVLISESMASQYFGPNWKAAEVLGSQLRFDNDFEMTITGVLEDVPENSHMQFDVLGQFSTLGIEWWEEFEDSWTFSNFHIYLMLAEGASPDLLQDKLPDFSRRHFKGSTVSGSIERFFLQPLLDIHLHSDFEYESWAHGDADSVWALLVVAFFILIIAWVNYVNLSVAKAATRTKEVSVRQVVGADRFQLMRQFLMEAFLTNVIAFLLALALVRTIAPAILPMFHNDFDYISDVSYLFIAIILFFIAGILLSGLYPSILMSSVRPAAALKGTFEHPRRGSFVRSSLVAIQFAISFGLIVGTATVYRQVQFMRDRDLGINIEQTLVLSAPRLSPWDSTFYSNIEAFKSEVVRHPGVRAATASTRMLGTRTGRTFDFQLAADESDRNHTVSHIGVDHDFFETFEVEVLAGREFGPFDHHLAFDAISSVVINASAVKMLGFGEPELAVGQRVRFWDREWEVVGVVGDHHQESLRVRKEPTVFLPVYNTEGNFFLKVEPGGLNETMASVEETFLAFFPGNLFDYEFLDAHFSELYADDTRFRNVFGLFSGLAIFLACMGLFGLASLMTSRRSKEIGIRKVLGASVSGLVIRLNRDFAGLVLAGAVTATPPAYLIMSRWLEGYAYRIDVGLWPFLTAAAIVVSIAVATVSYQSVRAATADPVEALRYE